MTNVDVHLANSCISFSSFMIAGLSKSIRTHLSVSCGTRKRGALKIGYTDIENYE